MIGVTRSDAVWPHVFEIGETVVWSWAVQQFASWDMQALNPACHTLLVITDVSLSRRSYDYEVRSLDTGNYFYERESDLADSSVIPGLTALHGRMSNQEYRKHLQL